MNEGTCPCGRPLIARAGDLEATCAECRARPGSCGCEPVGEAVDGAVVLDEAREVLTRYVVFPCPEAADAATLYAAATHAARRLEFAARLVIKSPVKRCGKTRLLDVLAPLVGNPLLTSDISAAALVRSISADDPPTIMLDEADATFGKALKGDEKAEHLRGILNAGFGRDRPYKRWDVTSRRVEDCPTFAMAVLAGIGDLPDTIEDRAVIIVLRRKTSAEPVRKYRVRRDKVRVRAAGDRLAAWAATIAVKAGEAEPDMPPGLDDRAEDVWEALVAIADLAGGGWPARARHAAQALTKGAGADGTLGERLLGDLRDVLGAADTMHTEAILAGLHGIDEAPWANWYGRPLDARDLAKLLKPYGVSSTTVKIDQTAKKGYRRDDFHEPWTRYLPSADGGSVTGVTSVTPQLSEGVTGNGNAHPKVTVTGGPPLSSGVTQVTEVTHTPRAGDPGRPGDTPGESPVTQVTQVTATDENGAGELPCAWCDEPARPGCLTCAGHVHLELRAQAAARARGTEPEAEPEDRGPCPAGCGALVLSDPAGLRDHYAGSPRCDPMNAEPDDDGWFGDDQLGDDAAACPVCGKLMGRADLAAHEETCEPPF